MRNQHPAQLTVLHLPPASVEPVAPGDVAARVDAAYTSLFLGAASNGASWIMDGEYLRTALTLRTGLAANVEVAAQLPFVSTSGGFLDSFIIDYHRLFGLPDQNRDASPKGAFRISAQRSGTEVYGVDKSSFELGDVPLQVTWQLAAPGPERLGFAVRGGLELPTGDEERGYGNGEFDAGLGALLEAEAGGIAFYGHVQHTFAGTPTKAARAGFEFADVTSAGLAVELPLGADLHAFAQFEWETSTLRRLELPAAARDQVLIWVGGRLRVDTRLCVELGFAEDLQTLVSPDFTAWLGLAWLPGARRS